MRAALADDNTLDRRATARARLSLLVIHTHMIVVVAGFSPKVPILAEGCSPMLDAKR
jgi:hypothetical protein